MNGNDITKFKAAMYMAEYNHMEVTTHGELVVLSRKENNSSWSFRDVDSVITFLNGYEAAISKINQGDKLKI